MAKFKFVKYLSFLSFFYSGILSGQVTVQFPATTGSPSGYTLTQSGNMTYSSGVALYTSANLSSYWGYITNIRWKGYGNIAYNIVSINAYLANTTNTSMTSGLAESYYRTTNGSVVTNPVQIAANASLALTTTSSWIGFSGLSYLLNNGQNLFVTFHCNASSANYAYFTGTGTALCGAWGAMGDNSNPTISVPPANSGCRPDITVVFGSPTISLPPTAAMPCSGATSIPVLSSTLSTSYQWLYCSTPGGTYSNVTDGTPSGAVYSNTTTNNLGISGINAAGNYYYKCIAYNGNAANTTSATYTTLSVATCCTPPASVSLSGYTTPICSGTDPGIFTASATGGSGGSYSYLWYKNGISTGTTTQTYDAGTLSSNSDIYCSVSTGSGCTTNSPTATIIVNSAPAIVSIVADQNNVCSGTVVNFTASPTNGGTPNYAWFVNGSSAGTNSATFSYTPADGDQVYTAMTSTASCVTGSPATSNIVQMTVIQTLPASVSIDVDQNNICDGTMVFFTATPGNGGTPVYQWFVNGSLSGSNSETFSYSPANGDQVHAVMTSTASCVTMSPATSNTITMITNPYLTGSVSIRVNQNNVCSGTAVNFTAIPVNGGTPSFQWYVNNTMVGSDSPAYSYTPVNGDRIYVAMTNTSGCLTGSSYISNTVTMAVLQYQPANVSIIVNRNNICSGATVDFTATPVNGGTPSYQWYVNNNPAGSNSSSFTYAPVNSDHVHVIMTSTANCVNGNPATSNTVIMTTLPSLPVSVTINVDQNNICSGIAVNFSANPTNGGSPSYRWYVNNSLASINSATYSYIPGNGDQVYVVMTSDISCVSGNPATSNIITMTTLPNPTAGVSISTGQNSVCTGATVVFTAIPDNGGTPHYQWFVNSTQSGTNSSTFSYVPANGDQVHVVMTSTASCVTGNPATSNTVTMTVLPYLPAGVSISADQNNICDGTTVHFSAMPANGGTPTYQWYVNGSSAGTNSSTYTYSPSDSDQVYVIMTSSASCITGNPATSNVIIVSSVPSLPASVSIEVNQNNICSGTTVTFIAAATNGGTPVYQWYLNNTMVGADLPTYSYIPVNGDRVHVRMSSSLNCVTGNPYTSSDITMNVHSCTGIESLKPDAASLIIYPNPAKDKLFVNLDQLSARPLKLKIFNTLGQICFESNQPIEEKLYEIPLNNFKPGNYSLQITYTDGLTNKAFIIK